MICIICNKSYDLSVAAHGGLIVNAQYIKCDCGNLFYGFALGIEYADIFFIHYQDFMARNRTEHILESVKADTDDLPGGWSIN